MARSSRPRLGPEHPAYQTQLDQDAITWLRCRVQHLEIALAGIRRAARAAPTMALLVQTDDPIEPYRRALRVIADAANEALETATHDPDATHRPSDAAAVAGALPGAAGDTAGG